MNSYPSIHDAYGGFGDKNDKEKTSTVILQPKEQGEYKGDESQINLNDEKFPTDASHSNYPTKIKCPKCHKVGITRLQSELGTAAWVWCVLLSPFACSGLSCLCI